MVARCGLVEIVDVSGWSIADAERAVETARVNLEAARRLCEFFGQAPRNARLDLAEEREEAVEALQVSRALLVEAETVLRAVRARGTRAA